MPPSAHAATLPTDTIPSLKVTTPEETKTYRLLRPTITIGRSSGSDIILPQPIVSGRHAQLVQTESGYEIVDLGSKLGLKFEGRLITQRHLQPGDVIYIGSDITLTYLSEAATPEFSMPLSIRGKDLLRIGRAPDNDAVIADPRVTRYHAQIRRQKGALMISDLGSTNGTHVNGKAIAGERLLSVGDKIRIGPCNLILNIDETIVVENEAGRLRIDALALTKIVGGGKTLLDNISLSILPREFVVVAGVSGGGKSTLLDALNGFRPATGGSVLVNGVDLYQNFDAYRSELGYVPQKDIIHMELSVEQALDFAARLRMPVDTTPAERQQRVAEVMAELSLTKRRETPIKALSGGQLKRVSMGVELLTKPSLFFLDEATSGLDPGTEADVMQLLRQLADSGRTILLITHATENVKLCNLVVFLAAGGKVAYFGPPEQAPAFFGVKSFNEIYPKVERERSPEAWQADYLRSPQYQTYVVERQRALPTPALAGRSGRAAAAGPGNLKRSAGWRQFLILTQRNFAVLLRDRLSLALMLTIAPILGVLDLVTWNRNLFDVQSGNPGQAITMLFTTSLIAVMVGSLTTMREIAKEQDIYQRERMIGLQIVPYILSKVVMSILLAFIQSTIFLLFKYVAVAMPTGSEVLTSSYITLFLATTAGMLMGLMVSAIAPTQTIAPLLIILFLIPQVTFGGGIVPVPKLPLLGQIVNLVTITKWPFEALVTITDIGTDVANDDCWKKSKAERAALSEQDKAKCECLGPNVFSKCEFPGIRDKQVPEVNQPEPQEPPRPVTPDNPAEFANFKREMENYDKKIDTWKEDYRLWMVRRENALGEAEGVINQINTDFGFMFAVNVVLHWLVLGVIMAAMMAAIFVVQKRKDVV
jgi:ABC transport system ATP-binding/permease protein